MWPSTTSLDVSDTPFTWIDRSAFRVVSSHRDGVFVLLREETVCDLLSEQMAPMHYRQIGPGTLEVEFRNMSSGIIRFADR